MPGRLPRRRALRGLAAVAGVLVLVLVATLAVAATVVRRPLPDHAGARDLPGLDAEVLVLRDARGVPDLYADSPQDLFRAQGYVDAQDRFFTMDLRRHITAGRLSELVGASEEALDADTVVRTLGWRRVAEQELELLDEETLGYLQDYADGVNAYLEQHDLESLGVEYAVLGQQVDLGDPEPWTPLDSVTWLKAMAWDLKANYADELGRAQAYSTVRDVERVEELYPVAPAQNQPIVAAVAAADPAAAAVAGEPRVLLGSALLTALDQVQAALEAVPVLVGQGEGTGSNSWVVAGEHTASGSPVLANDPHLSLSAPGIWSQVGLHCTTVGPACPFDVSGFSFAGYPGVIIGHNADLAWGLTNMGADVTDFVVERTDRDAGTYLRDGEQVPLDVRTETIEVAGGDPVEIEIRSTVHGPIVSGVLETDRLAGTPLPDGARGMPEVALEWTALTPGRTADAVVALNLAQDADDVAAAAALFDVPAQNIVFATVDGHIGYQAPGRIPVRSLVTDGPVPSDGTWPRPGWDSRYDWQGWVDPADLPSALDPAEGYVVAANQTVSPDGPALGADVDHGYRAQRLRDELDRAIAAGETIDVASTGLLQTDQWSPFANALVPALLEAPVPATDGFTRGGVDLLAGWDGTMAVDSPAAAYFAAVWADLLRLTFHDDLPESQWPNGGSRWLTVVTLLLEEPDSPWWDDRTTVNVVESRDEILVRALTSARLELTVSLGKNPSGWQWGRLHQAAPQHAVLGGDAVPSVVRRLMNPTPVAVGGGSSIVDAMAWNAASGSFEVTAGPSMRMVVDLGDLDASTWVNLTGTSGHPGSVHYTDQFSAWAEGRTFPWAFGQQAVDDAAVRRLTLRPAPAG